MATVAVRVLSAPMGPLDYPGRRIQQGEVLYGEGPRGERPYEGCSFNTKYVIWCDLFVEINGKFTLWSTVNLMQGKRARVLQEFQARFDMEVAQGETAELRHFPSQQDGPDNFGQVLVVENARLISASEV